MVLNFYRSELLDDLAQYGYVEGDVMSDDKQDGKHQTQDIIQDGNINIVTRHLDLALARCRERLYPYTKTEVGDRTVKHDVLQETNCYVITMLVPDDFSDTSAEWLEQLIHNLLVYYVLYYWLSITKPDAADKWLVSASALEEEIKGTLAARIGRVRRPLNPF